MLNSKKSKSGENSSDKHFNQKAYKKIWLENL